VSKTKGLVAAVLAYTAWGPLAPLGVLLLEDTGPFSLNVLRTAGSIVLFALLMGPKKVASSLRALGRDWRPWLLGFVGLGGTFGAYLGSLVFLEPTIAALTIYLSPILVAGLAHRFLGERKPRLVVTTLVLTLVGGAIAVLEPSQGVKVPASVWFGLFLGLIGVIGWTFYTLYLRHLGPRYDDNELTMTAFITSGLFFLLVALIVPSERLSFDADRTSLLRLAAYILVPSFLSFRLYATAIRHAGASITAVLLGIELVATAFFSKLLTDEGFSPDKIIGVAIVLVAVTIFLVREARSAAPPQAGEAHGQQA
jgi:drug/metabolite transporter (DMT)-like permease